MQEPPATSFTGKGGWWVVLQALLMIGVILIGPLFCQLSQSIFVRSIAILMMVLGAMVGVLGVKSLGRSITPYPRPLPDGKLVRTGVYGWVRHPLYSSLIHMSFAWALLWHSGAVAVLSVLLTMLLYCKTLREEGWLREQYPDYDDYSAKVKRFVPRLF